MLFYPNDDQKFCMYLCKNKPIRGLFLTSKQRRQIKEHREKLVKEGKKKILPHGKGDVQTAVSDAGLEH